MLNGCRWLTKCLNILAVKWLLGSCVPWRSSLPGKSPADSYRTDVVEWEYAARLWEKLWGILCDNSGFLWQATALGFIISILKGKCLVPLCIYLLFFVCFPFLTFRLLNERESLGELARRTPILNIYRNTGTSCLAGHVLRYLMSLSIYLFLVTRKTETTEWNLPDHKITALWNFPRAQGQIMIYSQCE